MKYADLKSPAGRAMNRILRRMLEDLEGNYHEVVLIPAPEPMHSGHKVRAVQYQNAAWYQKFVKEYMSIRGRGRKRYLRPRTFIVKGEAIKALRRMTDGDFSGIYAERIVRFVEVARAKRKMERRGIRERSKEVGFNGIPF